MTETSQDIPPRDRLSPPRPPTRQSGLAIPLVPVVVVLDDRRRLPDRSHMELHPANLREAEQARKAAAAAHTEASAQSDPPLPSDPVADCVDENNCGIAKLTKVKDNARVMPNDKILEGAAKLYRLDRKEADLALMAAAAGKEVAQHAATATDDEMRRLRDMRRLWDLRLDLHQKLQAAADLPDPVQTRAQYRAAASLVKTQDELRQLEEKLFGPDQVSEKEVGARRAKRLMHTFERSRSSLAA